NNLPDFNTLTPVATGNVSNVNLNNALSTVNYAFTWTGYINIPVTGTYAFQTSSDDGSKLYIDVPYSAAATPTVNNDGLHGTNTVTSSNLTLTAGVHTFVATFFQQGGGAVMGVNWKTPQTGGNFVAIPDAAFTQGLTAAGTAPTAPSGLTATAASAKKINLTWQDNSSNETGFQLFRSTSAAGPFVVIATVKPNRTSYGDSSLTANTTYYYKIQAINQYGSSKFNLQDSSSLAYNFYSPYNSNDLSAIAASTPTSTGSSTNFSLGVTTATNNFALQFNGFVNIPTAGSYTFYTSSDDGSNLLLDGTLLVNNDGLHATQENSGTRTLTAGLHAIQVNFFQQGGGQVLTVSYAVPGISKTTIPDIALTIPPVSATTQPLPAIPP
ncbi:MAG: PA14 domain-containing protein, partial [Chitinophaga rupis]